MLADWYRQHGDTAKPAKRPGGGILTARLLMKSDDAVRLYREEKAKRSTPPLPHS